MNLEEIIETLTTRNPLPPLNPTKVWKKELAGDIELLDCSAIIKAGLHMWNDDLTNCHKFAKIESSPEANYWHAILHRRQGDYGNSKYWIRNLPDHPVYQQMAQQFPGWNPLDFVDECAREASTQNRETLKKQAWEMLLLIEFLAPSYDEN